MQRKLVFNKLGTRLYTTDRFKDQVRVFDITPGPAFRQMAEIPTGTNDLDRANPRDLALSDDEHSPVCGQYAGTHNRCY